MLVRETRYPAAALWPSFCPTGFRRLQDPWHWWPPALSSSGRNTLVSSCDGARLLFTCTRFHICMTWPRFSSVFHQLGFGLLQPQLFFVFVGGTVVCWGGGWRMGGGNGWEGNNYGSGGGLKNEGWRESGRGTVWRTFTVMMPKAWRLHGRIWSTETTAQLLLQSWVPPLFRPRLAASLWCQTNEREEMQKRFSSTQNCPSFPPSSKRLRPAWNGTWATRSLKCAINLDCLSALAPDVTSLSASRKPRCPRMSLSRSLGVTKNTGTF